MSLPLTDSKGNLLDGEIDTSKKLKEVSILQNLSAGFRFSTYTIFPYNIDVSI